MSMDQIFTLFIANSVSKKSYIRLTMIANYHHNGGNMDETPGQNKKPAIEGLSQNQYNNNSAI